MSVCVVGVLQPGRVHPAGRGQGGASGLSVRSVPWVDGPRGASRPGGPRQAGSCGVCPLPSVHDRVAAGRAVGLRRLAGAGPSRLARPFRGVGPEDSLCGLFALWARPGSGRSPCAAVAAAAGGSADHSLAVSDLRPVPAPSPGVGTVPHLPRPRAGWTGPPPAAPLPPPAPCLRPHPCRTPWPFRDPLSIADGSSGPGLGSRGLRVLAAGGERPYSPPLCHPERPAAPFLRMVPLAGVDGSGRARGIGLRGRTSWTKGALWVEGWVPGGPGPFSVFARGQATEALGGRSCLACAWHCRVSAERAEGTASGKDGVGAARREVRRT